jgi:hypothetical protein
VVEVEQRKEESRVAADKSRHKGKAVGFRMLVIKNLRNKISLPKSQRVLH